MGRKKKYNTKEEKYAAQKKWQLDYYYRNKDRLNKERMEKYYELRKNLHAANNSGEGPSS
jgi:hypothetical protein